MVPHRCGATLVSLYQENSEEKVGADLAPCRGELRNRPGWAELARSAIRLNKGKSLGALSGVDDPVSLVVSTLMRGC